MIFNYIQLDKSFIKSQFSIKTAHCQIKIQYCNIKKTSFIVKNLISACNSICKSQGK